MKDDKSRTGYDFVQRYSLFMSSKACITHTHLQVFSHWCCLRCCCLLLASGSICNLCLVINILPFKFFRPPTFTQYSFYSSGNTSSISGENSTHSDQIFKNPQGIYGVIEEKNKDEHWFCSFILHQYSPSFFYSTWDVSAAAKRVISWWIPECFFKILSHILHQLRAPVMM